MGNFEIPEPVQTAFIGMKKTACLCAICPISATLKVHYVTFYKL